VSRIEHALEQAVKMREAQRAAQGDASEGTIASGKAAELSDHAALPVFEGGDAAVDPAAVDRHLVSITDPRSIAAEQYKKLRARILKATRKEFHNAIMITSCNPGEGKSITAINLAVSLSEEINHTVLLVDADLRSPSLHGYLGLEPRYGLSEYLQGGMELRDLLIKTGLGKLVILPGGNPSTRPAELLSSDRMKALVHEMKLRYKDRYVIFDSTPLLSTADALSLGNYMDGILFVIQGGRTSEKAAAQTLSLMKGWNILGVVYNDVSPYLTRNVSHRYYHYYGYDRSSLREAGK
jgi:protein-tyrosine kinase